jgi:protein-S-isoprenylcysteine O-methyltransferase Ste14
MDPVASSVTASLARQGGRERSARQDLSERWVPALVFATLALVGFGSALKLGRGTCCEPSLGGALLGALDVAHGGLSALFCGLVSLLFLIRRSPGGRRADPLALGVALVGTFVMGLVTTQPSTTGDWRVLALADLLLVGGLAFSIYAVACLGRCFGLAPEARGLVTSGAYRLVRHPLYLGELGAATGALLPVLAPPSVAIFGLFCLCQVGRAVLEERVLTATFPEYATYRRRTPALLPWLRPRARHEPTGTVSISGT